MDVMYISKSQFCKQVCIENKELKAKYNEQVEDYNKLVDAYTQLNADYDNLLFAHESVLKSYTKLQEQYKALEKENVLYAEWIHDIVETGENISNSSDTITPDRI